MRIIIIGKSGQLATALRVSFEANDRNDVICFGRNDINISDENAVLNQLDDSKGDIVINTAAYTDVDGAEDDAEKAFAINATATGFLARATRSKGIPFVHFSTDYVFDGSGEDPYSEEDPTSPMSVYGQSKLAGEQVALRAAHKCIILRTAWLYSPFGNNFVKTMLRLAENREELSVVDDQIGNPTYAFDLAASVLRLVEAITEPSFSWNTYRGIYHVAGSGEATWVQMARHIFAVSEARGGPSAKVTNTTTEAFGAKAPRPRNSRLNTDKFNNSFSHRLPDWQTGIERCVEAILA